MASETSNPEDRCGKDKAHTPHWNGRKWCDGRKVHK